MPREDYQKKSTRNVLLILRLLVVRLLLFVHPACFDGLCVGHRVGSVHFHITVLRGGGEGPKGGFVPLQFALTLLPLLLHDQQDAPSVFQDLRVHFPLLSGINTQTHTNVLIVITGKLDE